MIDTKTASFKYKTTEDILLLLLKIKPSYRNVIFICIIISLFSCNNFQRNSSHQQTSNSSIAAGKQLATTYCASCHQLPDPSMLDVKSWENGVLPQMGPRLGIF